MLAKRTGEGGGWAPRRDPTPWGTARVLCRGGAVLEFRFGSWFGCLVQFPVSLSSSLFPCSTGSLAFLPDRTRKKRPLCGSVARRGRGPAASLGWTARSLQLLGRAGSAGSGRGLTSLLSPGRLDLHQKRIGSPAGFCFCSPCYSGILGETWRVVTQRGGRGESSRCCPEVTIFGRGAFQPLDPDRSSIPWSGGG